jgi:hypothetical protein
MKKKDLLVMIQKLNAHIQSLEIRTAFLEDKVYNAQPTRPSPNGTVTPLPIIPYRITCNTPQEERYDPAFGTAAARDEYVAKYRRYVWQTPDDLPKGLVPCYNQSKTP